MHIGLIGGIGPAATELYYRGLIRAHSVSRWPLELTIVHADVSVLMENLLSGASRKQANIFLNYIVNLKAGGAQEVAISALAGHFCLSQLVKISPLPIISALDAIEQHLRQAHIGRIGVLGTLPVMQSKLFGGLNDIEIVTPDLTEMQKVQNVYAAMAQSSTASDAQRNYLFDVGNGLVKQQGAEAILLAGTDLFLAFGGQEPGFNVIDSAEVHIDAIARRSKTLK